MSPGHHHSSSLWAETVKWKVAKNSKPNFWVLVAVLRMFVLWDVINECQYQTVAGQQLHSNRLPTLHTAQLGHNTHHTREISKPWWWFAFLHKVIIVSKIFAMFVHETYCYFYFVYFFLPGQGRAAEEIFLSSNICLLWNICAQLSYPEGK